MTDISENIILNRLLDPVAKCFTPMVAEEIARLRADETVQARLDELAAKSNAGSLTDEERREYEMYVDALDVVGVLQAKARDLLLKQRREQRTPGAVDEFLDRALNNPEMRRVLEAWAK
jgi:hypothetical protein